jgi:hypothetical protein
MRTLYKPGVQRQLRVKDTAFDRKLLEEELHAVAAVDIVDKNDALSLDEL